MERSAFTPSRGRDVVLPGISSTFAELFPIRRWVTHALLTRAPLYFPEQARDFSYDLHVLCTPPAFILSQDQTRHFCSETERFRLPRQVIRAHEIDTLFSFQRSRGHAMRYFYTTLYIFCQAKNCCPVTSDNFFLYQRPRFSVKRKNSPSPESPSSIPSPLELSRTSSGMGKFIFSLHLPESYGNFSSLPARGSVPPEGEPW